MATQAVDIRPQSDVAAIIAAYFDHRVSFNTLDEAVTAAREIDRFKSTNAAWAGVSAIAATAMATEPQDLADAAIVLGLAASWLDSVITASDDGYSNSVSAGVAIVVGNVAKLLLDLHPAANSTEPVNGTLAELRSEAEMLLKAAGQ